MGTLIDTLVDPFRPGYMQTALLEIGVLSVACGSLGAWVVLRRLAFLSHALGHCTFPALVVAALAGWSLVGTSLVASLVVAVILGFLANRRQLADGVAVAIVLSTALAIGAVLVSGATDIGQRADTLLFGTLLGVSDADIWRSGAAAVLALAVAVGLGRPLMAATFDSDLAQSGGVPARLLTLALLSSLAVTVSATVSIVGALMVSALILVPAATAALITRRLPTLITASVALTFAVGAGGLWLSVRLDAPPGGCIAVVAVGAYLVVALTASLVARRPQMGATAS